MIRVSEKMIIINNKFQKIVQPHVTSLVILLLLILASLLVPYGLNGENWIYWLFNRILFETGKFIIFERSPLYTLYLVLFNWMGYPLSVTAEYVTTAIITLSAFYVFFRRFIPAWASLFVSVLWMPFLLYYSVPQVQLLALAFSLFAVMSRLKGHSRKNLVRFYFLMFVAYSFRATYQFMILLFLGWDIWKVIKEKGLSESIKRLKPRTIDWPIAAVFATIIAFSLFQSPHRWNNANGTDVVWFPSDWKTLSEASAVQTWNWKYIEREFGSTEGKDFYFTHSELFGEADTLWDMFAANSSFIIDHVLRNVGDLLSAGTWFFYPMLSSFFILALALQVIVFDIYRSCSRASPLMFAFTGIVLLFLIVLSGYSNNDVDYSDSLAPVVVLYGALRFFNETKYLKVFVLGSFLLAALTVVHIPKIRYLLPILPVLSCSSIYYSKRLCSFITDYISTPKKLWIVLFTIGCISIIVKLTSDFVSNGYYWPIFKTVEYVSYNIAVVSLLTITSAILSYIYTTARTLQFFRASVLTVFLLVFSNGHVLWPRIMNETMSEISRGNIYIYSYGRNIMHQSMRKSYKQINSLVKSCNGIMSYETSFIGAFMDVGLDKLYNVFEIPPFGEYGSEHYSGLNPERVDCLLISDNLANGPGGWGSNDKIRYDNYVHPYADRLISMGAVVHEIPYYGKAVIYDPQ